LIDTRGKTLLFYQVGIGFVSDGAALYGDNPSYQQKLPAYARKMCCFFTCMDSFAGAKPSKITLELHTINTLSNLPLKEITFYDNESLHKFKDPAYQN